MKFRNSNKAFGLDGKCFTEVNGNELTITRTCGEHKAVLKQFFHNIEAINSNVEEINNEKDQIVETIQSTASISEENSASSEEIAASTQEVTISAENLANTPQLLADYFCRWITKILLIKRFKDLETRSNVARNYNLIR